MGPIELARFVVEHAERAAAASDRRARFRQGARKPPLPNRVSDAFVEAVATTRLLGMADAPSRALVAIANGERPARLYERPLTVLEVLSLQAEGTRCVSALPTDEGAGVHATALGFVLHDLCHLEKFVDPEHHDGQVGFFRAARRAIASPAWAGIEARLGLVPPLPGEVGGEGDSAWRADLAQVFADMNGSCIFLFAALKMKLKMAVRRALHRDAALPGAPPVLGKGGLTPEESEAYEGLLARLVEAFELEGPLAVAATKVSTRRDDADAALTLLRHFEGRGSA